MTDKKSTFIVKLIVAILLCEATGITSSLLATVVGNTWYQELTKPSWNPPNYLFGPVWSSLYLMMGISLAIIWNLSKTPGRQVALWLFATQLFLNFWWSIIFFQFHSLTGALIEIVLLWLLIQVTIVQFSKHSKAAAWLLVPYAAWVTFASILTFTIWSLNG
jgi:benzodiazapine receptor